MFFDPRSGSEDLDPFQTDTPATIGVRHLGLNLNGGMWALPAFSPAIQTSNLDVSAGGKLLAGFALAAHSQGLPLPEQPYTTLLDALKAQFTNYLRQVAGDSELLPMSLHLVLEDQTLQMIGSPEQHLPLVKLREVVEEINALHPDLGWYIPETIAMSHGVGMPVYDPCRMSSFAEYMWFGGAQTDEEMAAEVLCEEITEENRELLLAQLHEEHAFTPSTWSTSMGGNAKLWHCAVPGRTDYFVRKLRKAIRDERLSEKARTALQHALDLNRLLQRQQPHGFGFNRDLPEEGEQIGALAFVVWDDTELPNELVSHFESSAYECEAHEETLHRNFDLQDREQWPHIIAAFKAYVGQFVAFSKLLRVLEHKENQHGD